MYVQHTGEVCVWCTSVIMKKGIWNHVRDQRPYVSTQSGPDCVPNLSKSYASSRGGLKVRTLLKRQEINDMYLNKFICFPTVISCKGIGNQQEAKTKHITFYSQHYSLADSKPVCCNCSPAAFDIVALKVLCSLTIEVVITTTKPWS